VQQQELRSELSLVVRDLVHEKVFAKALETLGVNWGKALSIPRIDTSGMREVRDLERRNLHNQMWTFQILTFSLVKVHK
jgi:Mn-containing catalase